ncbi:hypothetical protein ZIOFF_048271 [Zingiber officinale]|uniref:BZIP domain-containing protein n=1 Tax=Zingiber officinale TaxID=94328 RepID=A0A8J5KS29_ZINOF|nr:hypothetical protein ZIOFF_048271 [Zingiber officinale]
MGMAMATQGAGRAQQDAQSQSLSRQGLACNLTLDQVQDHLGGPLLSMNLEDLLRNVFPAGKDSCSPAADSGAGAMRKKTVDEAWRHIQRGKEKERQQPRLGEMTLEDFLCRAGVAGDETNEGCGNKIVLGPTEHSLHHCHPQKQEQTVMGRNYVCQPPAPQSQAADSSPFDPQTPRRKRGRFEDVAKKKVERRQKRMIKNRESAARSRARKQARLQNDASLISFAYTNELEKKVSSLEEENQRLKQQKESDAMIQFIPQPYPKQQLRRTSSAPV